MLPGDRILQFERKISRIGDMHLDFERQFKAFTSIVPYKYNKIEVINDIFSPRLYSLLQGINSNVDAMCKILADIFDLKPVRDRPTAYDYFLLLNNQGMLSSQVVSLLEKPEPFKPFVLVNNELDWWVANNKTKHELPEGASHATYGNVIKALGALVSMLHISHISLSQANMHNILDSKHWRDNTERFIDAFKALEFESFTSVELDWSRREYLNSQQKKYRSRHYYYLSDFMPPANSQLLELV
jgi:hypothetical protein